MKYRIGDAIIGCMTSTLKNIETGLKLFPCLTWGDSLVIRFTSVKHLLMRWCEGINLNLISFCRKKIIDDIINMPSKKKVKFQPRPIDAIRELFEEQQLQISDLTEIIKKQDAEIRTLKAKWNARESLEKERKEEEERKKAEEDKSWFWASRTSE